LRLVTMTQQSNQIELRENRLMSQSNHRISCVWVKFEWYVGVIQHASWYPNSSDQNYFI
jgi:hypothetical protein